jgi:cytochrome c oxidase subunit 1
VFHAKRLVLAHFWVAFAAFAVAILLGEWQMIVRSPLHAWISNPEHYYRSVTAHGTWCRHSWRWASAMRSASWR